MTVSANQGRADVIRRTVEVLKSSRKLMEYVGLDFSLVPGVPQHAGQAIAEIEWLRITLDGLLPKSEKGRATK